MANGYAGKIKNTGAQEIKAVYPQGTSAKGNVIKTGNDLRVKGGSKK